MSTGRPPTTAPQRSRARTLAPLGVLLWLALDIWLLTLVGRAAGALTVWLLVIAGLVAGGFVVKAAGRRTSRRWASLAAMLQQPGAGRPQAPDDTENGHNGFLLLGGVLLMIPGVISDAAGLLLLVPRVRSALAGYTERSIQRSLERRLAASGGGFEDLIQQARRARTQQEGTVVQGEVIRDDRPGGDAHDGDGPRPPLPR
jgi:UPF0716 protein FxsA